ncbi:RNA polymerase sigma factor [Bacteroides propionicifaciens]|uniref:RNA polymerase sigma factor n=1 Tax=Bacteroides propionicifaciens TaxID=392838 RepID=UPI00036A3F83|nr:sigma-70 family RNA polymerase sigma factor [Bacteroides propionicifaciens]
MEELELSKLCLSHDTKAQQMLYEQYSDRLYAICIRYAGDRDIAQDLLHDGFIKILSSFDKFTWLGEGSLRAWMDRIIVNTALQYLRDKKRAGYEVEFDQVSENNFDHSDSADVDVVPQKVLFEFIKELPDGYRTVFNLYVLEDKSHKEIGELLGINERSSASQLFRAKKVLAERVNSWLKNNA